MIKCTDMKCMLLWFQPGTNLWVPDLSYQPGILFFAAFYKTKCNLSELHRRELNQVLKEIDDGMLFLLCNLFLVICHVNFVLPDGLPRDDVDVGCSTFVVAAAHSPHILGHLLIRLVLHVSHLRRIVPPPCLLILPYVQQLLQHMTSVRGDS